MHRKLSVGLLPLYISLYDRIAPQLRPRAEKFYALIAEQLTDLGLEVHTSPLCCIQEQFSRAVESFESKGVDALVTLHLAYSPSLESERALKRTRLPIIVLDTTPDESFTWDMDHERINDNHGIHGVQDMCCMLARNDKRYVVAAGHWRNSDVLNRVCDMVRAASVYTSMRGGRVGLVGEPFNGMGDFNIPEDRMQTELGLSVLHYPVNDVSLLNDISQQCIDEEWNRDSKRCIIDDLAIYETYIRAERTGQAILNWARRENLLGFTMNFMSEGCGPAFSVMPFMAAEKGMKEGLGYAGEGDVLGAAFVGALIRAYPQTSFAEMFCPDWAGNRIFFSHMGELNLSVADGLPRMVKIESAVDGGTDSVAAAGRYKGGRACYVNLSPRAKGFRLILVDGEMEQLPDNMGTFETEVRGWFKPCLPVSQVLELYSNAGGTHHGALVYGDAIDNLSVLARLSDWDLTVIR